MNAAAAIPSQIRVRLLRLLEKRPARDSNTINAPGKSVFSCSVVRLLRKPAVAEPQTQFSSGAVSRTLSGPEKAATSCGLLFAAGKLSAM